MEERLINFETFGCRQYVSKELMKQLSDAIVSAAHDTGADDSIIRGAKLEMIGHLGEWISDGLVIRFIQTVATSEPIHGEHSFYYPASWWDHWKQDCCPNWLKKVFPRMARVNSARTTFKYVKFEKMCPHIHRSDFPGHMPHVRWLIETGHDLRVKGGDHGAPIPE